MSFSTPRVQDDRAIFEAFVALSQRAPEWAWRAGKQLGANAFVMPPERPLAMPVRGVVSIEASFGDTPSKAKRKRGDQEKARFSVKLQVCTTVSRGVSDPTFTGHALFFSPDRALSNARELAKGSKCLTPLSPEYLSMIEETVEGLARSEGLMVGLIYTKPTTGGTFYHDRQIILADAQGLADHKLDGALILAATNKGMAAFTLPRTSTNSSKGKALTYAMQSRGTARSDTYSNEWGTGTFAMQRS